MPYYHNFGDVEFLGTVKINNSIVSKNDFEKAIVGNCDISWRTDITYSTGVFVTYNSKLYYSLQTNNLNKIPSSNPLYWSEYSSISSFLELSDTPSSFTGFAGKVVVVKNDETGLEFVTYNSGGLQNLDYYTTANGITLINSTASSNSVNFVFSVNDAKLVSGANGVLYSQSTLDINNESFYLSFKPTGDLSDLNKISLKGNSDGISINSYTDASVSNRTRILLPVNGAIALYSETASLTFNGALLNAANGLVQVNSSGKIPSTLIDAGSGSFNGVYLATNSGLIGNGLESTPLAVDTGISAGKIVKVEADGKISPSLYNSGASGSASAKALSITLNGTDETTDLYEVTYDAINFTVKIKHNIGRRVTGILYDSTNKQIFLGLDYFDENTIILQYSSDSFPTSNNINYILIQGDAEAVGDLNSILDDINGTNTQDVQFLKNTGEVKLLNTYAPTNDFDIATKKYVDDSLQNEDSSSATYKVFSLTSNGSTQTIFSVPTEKCNAIRTITLYNGSDTANASLYLIKNDGNSDVSKIKITFNSKNETILYPETKNAMSLYLPEGWSLKLTSTVSGIKVLINLEEFDNSFYSNISLTSLGSLNIFGNDFVDTQYNCLYELVNIQLEDYNRIWVNGTKTVSFNTSLTRWELKDGVTVIAYTTDNPSVTSPVTSTWNTGRFTTWGYNQTIKTCGVLEKSRLDLVEIYNESANPTDIVFTLNDGTNDFVFSAISCQADTLILFDSQILLPPNYSLKISSSETNVYLSCSFYGG